MGIKNILRFLVEKNDLKGTPAAFVKKRRRLHLPAAAWQGQKDLNPRHVVLETTALPTELYPYIAQRLHRYDACLL